MTCFMFSLSFGGRNFAVFANFSVFWRVDVAAVYSLISLASVTVFPGSSSLMSFWCFGGWLLSHPTILGMLCMLLN